MEVSGAQNIFVYPKQTLEYRKKFIQRHKIEDLKKISDSQIEFQYKVLSSARFSNEEQSIYLKKTNKNRYIDILVYNHSRVKCNSSTNFYCNASHMKSILDNKDFAIFAQAPTPEGFFEFWQMIYEKNVHTIIMLCNFVDPKRGRQSEQYWPDLGKKIEIKHVAMTVENEKQETIEKDFVITSFNLQGKDGQKKVKHIHWTGWSDLKKPLGQENERIFRGLVQQCLSLIKKNQMFVIHCSAGIGRTGTLGAVIEGIRCADTIKQLSVFEIVQNLRKHRMYCVQTFQQYRFVYQEIKGYFTL